MDYADYIRGRGTWDGDEFYQEYDSPGDSGLGKKHRGFLPGNAADEQAMLDYMSGKSSNTSAIPRHLLSNQYGASGRFLSRVAMRDFKNDAGLARYKDFLQNMQEGGAGRKIRRASREATSRAESAQRNQAMTSFESGLGGGMDSAGLRYYTNEKMDNALAGQMGQAYQSAALADMEARFRAGQGMQGLADQRNQLYNMMIGADMGTISANQRTTTGGSFMGDIGGALLGGLGGAFLGPIGGAAGAAVGDAIFKKDGA